MVQLLHVLDSEADFQTQRCVQLLSGHLGEGFHVQARTLGRRGDWRSLPAAALALRRTTTCNLVHAWGIRALTAAALGARCPILYTPDASLDSRSVAWLRAIMDYRSVQVICPTATIQRALVTRGIPMERCHLIRPGVEFAKIRRRRDVQLRTALGFSPQDYVLLATGESTRAASHRDAIWAAAITNVLDGAYKLLLWGRGNEIPAVEQFSQHLINPDLLYIAEQRLGRKVEFEDLLPAADMILVTAAANVPVLPICIAMAAALPIVSTVTSTTSELLEDHHTALMVPKHSPRRMAQRILQLREDSSLQWRLSDTARAEAYEYYSATRFLDQYRAAYRQLAASEKVVIPQPAPAAASRFHGRV